MVMIKDIVRLVKVILLIVFCVLNYSGGYSEKICCWVEKIVDELYY